jgi:hypothetical protein
MKANLLLIAQIGFILLTIVCLWLLVKELKKGIAKSSWDEARKKKFFNAILITIILWMGFVSIWSASGIMSDFSKFPFNFMPVIAIPLITIVIFLFSSRLSEILQNIPVANLIHLQSFRFFVELLLWALFTAGLAPEQMTFEGRNFDILTGITAPLMAWLVSKNKISKAALIVWNLAGLLLLINIVTVAILSTPSPLRVFMIEPANTIVALFPVSWLPGFLVPLAYTLHFFSLKQLLSKSAMPLTWNNA